jgi:dCTP deaminase
LILGYRELANAWKSGRIEFDPEIESKQIGLSSIDLRLGYVFTTHKDVPGLVVDPLAEGFEPSNITETVDLEKQTLPPGQEIEYILKPRKFVLGRTFEKMRLPPDLAAQVQGVTTAARAGLTIHATAPHIHPGFAGPITLELCNVGSWDLKLVPGGRICQIIFFKLKTPVTRKQVETLSSYLNQVLPFERRVVGRRMPVKTRATRL